MLNILESYIRNSLPGEGEFATNPNLAQKVDEKGEFLPFAGNTVVFLLPEDVKAQLEKLREDLYRAAPEMLARRLQTPTFHMTLHDLVNGPGELAALEERMREVEIPVRNLLAKWRGQAPLRMRGTWVFNMVNTSLVLGLAPADEECWRRLDGMYCDLERVLCLGYGLTPHITLAYYRPGVYAAETVRRLREALGPVELELELRMEDLVLQTFEDMNHYFTAAENEEI